MPIQGKGSGGEYEGETYSESRPQKPSGAGADEYPTFPPTSNIKGRGNTTGTHIMAMRQEALLMKAITFPGALWYYVRVRLVSELKLNEVSDITKCGLVATMKD